MFTEVKYLPDEPDNRGAEDLAIAAAAARAAASAGHEAAAEALGALARGPLNAEWVGDQRAAMKDPAARAAWETAGRALYCQRVRDQIGMFRLATDAYEMDGSEEAARGLRAARVRLSAATFAALNFHGGELWAEDSHIARRQP